MWTEKVEIISSLDFVNVCLCINLTMALVNALTTGYMNICI